MRMESPELYSRLSHLKKQKSAVLLAHYYQEASIQKAADFVGDSLELAKAAKGTDAKMIVFAGVHFMAEGAKILNPSKKVLLPDLRAGCSLSDSCPPDRFALFRAQHPNHFVVSYINCSAAIKAQSDVICTSSNAAKIVARAPKDRPILFAPDKNLGAWVEKQTGRKMTLWPGSCIVHETFSERKLIDLKVEYPKALVIAHPECEETILLHADFIGSTSALLRYTKESEAETFIVVTEAGILHAMQQASPGKKFIPSPPNQSCACNDCPFMKLNTLEKVVRCLEEENPEVHLSEDLRTRAEAPLLRMLEWS
jgi:quinolinate synthase